MQKVSVALLFIVGVALSVFLSRGPNSAPIATESENAAYRRVVASQTLRCGYGTWEPGVFKNPSTGQMEGLYVELIEAMAKMSGLVIVWGPETDWGQIPEALKTGKIDAFCSGMANDAARGKRLAYTNPLSYWTFDVLVRADDSRFPKENEIPLRELNKPIFASAYTEGDVLETIVKTEFPQVKGVPLPQLGTPADNLMQVVTHKTDFVIFPKIMFQSYEKTNPGKVRYLKITPPLRAYGNVIAVNMDDLKLQQLLNAGINELVNSGVYDEIMTKYDRKYPGAFLRIAPGYKS